MALRASGGICAGKTLCYFSDFATTAVGVFSPRKLARFYHGSWHADTNESKKNKNILKKVLTNVLTYVIIYSNSGILLLRYRYAVSPSTLC